MVESSPFDNVSIVADNESTFHGVAPVGPADSTMPEGINSHSRLVRGDGGWDAVDPDGNVLASFSDQEVRITVSWKADIFTDADEARLADSDDDALDTDTVISIFQADLGARGVAIERPTDPIHNEEWVALLAATYPEHPPRMH